ncbi:hypothetical protein FF38_06539 [Lucilia cuprina]|uniref:Uncharacterized protein n=1 Tax=Lucilia cuprina TaxID=7375 RepID=A0A0L0C4X7_LUCCU|nr:hypothetical protein FF38_06539 [Lucilia cuprina]
MENESTLGISFSHLYPPDYACVIDHKFRLHIYVIYLFTRPIDWVNFSNKSRLASMKATKVDINAVNTIDGIGVSLLGNFWKALLFCFRARFILFMLDGLFNGFVFWSIGYVHIRLLPNQQRPPDMHDSGDQRLYCSSLSKMLIHGPASKMLVHEPENPRAGGDPSNNLLTEEEPQVFSQVVIEGISTL